jgi:hypothetical protein
MWIRAMKAINMAATFRASFRSSVAPRQAASSTFTPGGGTSIFTFPFVTEGWVSGSMILAITSEAGADMSEAAIR